MISDQINKFSRSTTWISTVSNTPAQNMLFIAGDFNAKTGPIEALYSFNSVTNRNGQQLQTS